MKNYMTQEDKMKWDIQWIEGLKWYENEIQIIRKD